MVARAVVAASPLIRQRRAVVLAASVVVLATGLYLFLVMIRGDAYFARSDPIGRVFDEGVELSAAARVLDGQVPYRDFSLIYAPGQAYVLATVFWLFGESMPVARAYDLVIRLLLCLSVYALAQELTSARMALVPVALATIWLGAAYFYAYPMFPALLCGVLSTVAWLRFVRDGGRRWLFASGLLAAMALMFRHDAGVYLVASELVVLLAWWCAGRVWWRGNDQERRYSIRHVARSGGTYLLGLGVVLVPVAVYLLAIVPLPDLWYAFVVFPLVIFRDAFASPYPALFAPLGLLAGGPGSWGQSAYAFAHEYVYLDWVMFWTPLLIDVVALLYVAVVLVRCGRRQQENRAIWGIALVTVLALAFFNQAVHRADRLHSLPAGLLAFVVLCAVATRAYSAARFRVPLVVGLVLTALVLAPSYVLYPLGITRDALQWSDESACAACPHLTRAGRLFLFPDQAEAIHFIQQRARPDEAIFVGNARHDRTQANDALFAFVAGRRNGTRYDDLIAGLVGTAGTQERIVSDLQQNRVKWVILSTMFAASVEPNIVGRPTGVTRLDDFIRSHYVPVQEFGHYTIWERP